MPTGLDPDFDPLLGILKNRLGAQTPDELAQVEAEYVLARLMGLSLGRLDGTYDLRHLCAFHRYLSQDVYDWAGSLRVVDIGLGNSWFAHHRYIESAAKVIFDELAAEGHLHGVRRARFVQRLAYYMGAVNVLHPFRDGNGRAQRAFFSQLARDNGYRIRWEDLLPNENDHAAELSLHGDDSALESMLDRLVERPSHELPMSGPSEGGRSRHEDRPA